MCNHCISILLVTLYPGSLSQRKNMVTWGPNCSLLICHYTRDFIWYTPPLNIQKSLSQTPVVVTFQPLDSVKYQVALSSPMQQSMLLWLGVVYAQAPTQHFATCYMEEWEGLLQFWRMCDPVSERKADIMSVQAT